MNEFKEKLFSICLFGFASIKVNITVDDAFDKIVRLALWNTKIILKQRRRQRTVLFDTMFGTAKRCVWIAERTTICHSLSLSLSISLSLSLALSQSSIPPSPCLSLVPSRRMYAFNVVRQAFHTCELGLGQNEHVYHTHNKNTCVSAVLVCLCASKHWLCFSFGFLVFCIEIAVCKYDARLCAFVCCLFFSLFFYFFFEVVAFVHPTHIWMYHSTYYYFIHTNIQTWTCVYQYCYRLHRDVIRIRIRIRWIDHHLDCFGLELVANKSHK